LLIGAADFAATHSGVILRCEAATAASLEGWQQTPALSHPSRPAFAREGSGGHLRMTPYRVAHGLSFAGSRKAVRDIEKHGRNDKVSQSIKEPRSQTTEPVAHMGLPEVAERCRAKRNLKKARAYHASKPQGDADPAARHEKEFHHRPIPPFQRLALI